MKILGEKSLSSKVIVGLKTIFTIISIIDVIVLGIIGKIVRHIVMKENIQNNIFDYNEAHKNPIQKIDEVSTIDINLLTIDIKLGFLKNI